MSEAILIKVSSGCAQIDYIKKSSKRISASSSKGVKFLFKELRSIHIASQLLPSISYATWKHVNSFLIFTEDKTNHIPVAAPFSMEILCKMSSVIFLAAVDGS